MKRWLKRFAPVFLATSTLAATSRAADEELDALLDENVVTTASKVSELGSTAPGTSTVITADQIRAFGIRSIGEALDFLALGVTGARPEAGGTFGVRGVHIAGDLGEHVLVLIDGHAVNDFYRGGGPIDYDAGIPMELIDHIELVLGPGSVLYGSNAMLGVVNVITKRANAFPAVRAGVESDLPSGVRGYAGFGHEFRLFGAPSELTVALEYRRSNPSHFYGLQYAGLDPATGKPARYGDGPGDGLWGGRSTRNELHEEPALYARFLSGNVEASFRATSNRSPQNLGFAHFDDAANRSITRRFSLEVRHQASLSSVVQVR